jgi:hypothetical protein
MTTHEPTYFFPTEVIESAELALIAVLPNGKDAARAVKITLDLAATAVDDILTEFNELLAVSMGVNNKFADRQNETDETLNEIKSWWAHNQQNGEYDTKLAELGRLLTPHTQTDNHITDEEDTSSMTDKFIIEFDANAGLAHSLTTANTGLAAARTVIENEDNIPLPTKAKLQRIIGGAREWPNENTRDAWDPIAAARAGTVAHIEYLIDQLPPKATISQLRETIEQWRNQDFAAAIPDINRDIHVVLAELVHQLDKAQFETGVSAGEAMRYIRDVLLTDYRKIVQ